MPTSHAEIEDLLAHGAWMKRLARGLVRDDPSADDLVQDTYATVLRRPPPKDISVRGWLAGVLRNLARQRWRTERRRAAREERAAEGRAAPPSTDELAARVEMQRLVAKLVLALDEPFRSTLVLRYFEGLSSAEIARRASVPASTVRWRLKRGLDALRDRLDVAHDGERRRWNAVLLPWLRPIEAPPILVAEGVAMGLKAKLICGLVALVLFVGGTIAFDALSSDEGGGVPVGGGGDGPAERAKNDEIHSDAVPPRLAGRGGDSAPQPPVVELPGRSVDEVVARGLSMRIRVVGPDDRPIPRIKLTVLTGTALRSRSWRREVVGGVHVEDTSDWGPLTQLWVLDPQDEDGDPLPFGPRVITNVERTQKELVVRLSAGRRLTGQVIHSDDRPVSGIRVIVRRPNVRGQAAVAGTAQSGADGGFVIEALPAEPLVVVPSLRNSSWPDAHPLPLEVGQTSVTVRLLRPSIYRVTVQGAGGDPVPGVTVHVSWVNEGTYAYRRGDTDSEGLVELKGVNNRLPLAVHVLTEGHRPPLPGFKKVGLPFGNGSLTVRLEATAAISGRVVDAEGKPVLRGTIVAEGVSEDTASFLAKVEPDEATGAFTLRVKPGAYRVWLEDSPGLATTRPAAVEAPVDGLHIVAAPYVEARGRLHVDKPQLWRLQWIQEPKSAHVTIEPDGHFKVVYIRQERATLLATRPGDPRVALLEAVSPTDGPIQVRPIKGQRIAGRIEGLDLAQGAGAVVMISRGPIQLFAKVQPNMGFSIDNVPFGVWRLELTQRHVLRGVIEHVEAGATDVLLIVDE